MGEKAPKGPKKDARDPAGISSAHPIILENQNMGNMIGRDRRERFRQCIILGWLIAVIGVDPVWRSDLLNRRLRHRVRQILHPAIHAVRWDIPK